MVAICFFAAMPFSPIAGIVPANATAPALIVVGYLMMKTLTESEDEAERRAASAAGCWPPSTSATWPTACRPCFTMTLMPLTYSITNGIGAGFLAHVAVRISRGEWRKVHWMMYLASAAFLLYFLFPLLRKKTGTRFDIWAPARTGAGAPARDAGGAGPRARAPCVLCFRGLR